MILGEESTGYDPTPGTGNGKRQAEGRFERVTTSSSQPVRDHHAASSN